MTRAMKVLVVDADRDVRDVVERALAVDKHAVIAAGDLTSARRAFAEQPDLVVIDLGLPHGTGFTLCRQLRAEGSQVPVLTLAATPQAAQRVRGLDAGADDCLSKPFAIVELRARVRALARRTRHPAQQTAPAAGLFGDVELELARRVATRAGSEVSVTSREWAILDVLAARRGAVVSRDDLLDLVWGESDEAHGNSLEVLVGRLRRKLGKGIIRTLRCEGYALCSRSESERQSTKEVTP